MPLKAPSTGSHPAEGVDEKPSMRSDHDDSSDTKRKGAAKGHGDHNLKYYIVCYLSVVSLLRSLLTPRQRIFQYSDRLDRLLYAVALLGAVAAGAALPLMTLVFGASTASFSNLSSGRTSEKEFRDRVNYLVLFFVYLFLARFVISYVATLCVSVAAARTTRSIRKHFLEHMLRKEIWHFDGHKNGSIAAQVTTSRYFDRPFEGNC
jgi:hypothetical protein